MRARLPRRRVVAALVTASALAVGAAVASVAPRTAPSGTTNAADASPPFVLMNELYGPHAASAAKWQLAHRLANGFDLHPPLSSSERRFLASAKPALAYFSVPSSAHVGACYPSASDPNTDARLTSLRTALGKRVWRLAMPEFDSGGRCWAGGRPSAEGLTDSEAYKAWMRYYRHSKGLARYLDQTPKERGYQWLSLCVFAFCPQYAYDMGADGVLLERNEDEVGGMAPGVAMLRGAARQHGDKPWGIDMSTWRYWNHGPTKYDKAGTLVTGWSTATFKRNMYAAYMSGAQLLHNEAADYTTRGRSRRLNPLGRTVQQFSDFALTRHPNRGAPYVPVAFMERHFSGFEPKFGTWMQAPYKWYWKKPYSAGDTMVSNLLNLAYPDHSAWGTIPPGAPWKALDAKGRVRVASSQAAYRRRLAGGADPRRWEPMGTSRWGETFDVITDRSSQATMGHYRAIVVATAAPLDDSLLTRLHDYVSRGGTVVLAGGQLAGAEALTGLHVTGGRGRATTAIWLPDCSRVAEDSYTYTVTTPTSASVIARTPSGDPVVTRNAVGAGAVYVATPDAMANDSGSRILDVGRRLLQLLEEHFAVLGVHGPPLRYLVTTSATERIVTLINTDLSGKAWSGTVTFPSPHSNYRVREWTTDVDAPSTIENGHVVVDAAVPPYDVRVYALEAAGTSTPSAAAPPEGPSAACAHG